MSRGKQANVQTALKRMTSHGVPRQIMEKLGLYLQEASDRELYKINPRYLADKLSVDTHTTLGVLAYAVQVGLFDLNWDIHCPHCGGRARTFFSLRNSRSEEFCPLCQVDFDTHLDHEVHVTFTLNETMRSLSVQEPLSTQESLPHKLYPPTFGLELLNVQPFRDLFSDQMLPPGESLKVKRVAFLFTDLRGSTAMYAREGDPRAYGWVREHFEVLFQAANRNHGVTVKTIGDAVMASFVSPADALQTSIDVHRGMKTLNRQLELTGDAALSIRLGTHVGPCLSVTLNDRLDYFGATVNIASRVSHLSQGNDVILTEEMLADQETHAEAIQNGHFENLEAELQGYDQHFCLQRLIFPIQEPTV
ncbi:MAG: adenylate/guanylate cyclase domain-containing protein [Chloroflexi bacterium]|nr:adenylate/guanylate cyclase domain-containing protein [Chloroflexota bacterium]